MKWRSGGCGRAVIARHARALTRAAFHAKPASTFAEGASSSRFLPMIRGMTAPSFMDLALKTAENAGKAGEVPIGCVIVRGLEVIATAGNRTLTDRDPTAHAEILALRQAADSHRHRAAGRLRSLCHAGALHDVRRRDLVRADPAALLRRGRPQGRRGRFRRAVFCLATCHHAPEVYPSVGESEAATLLRDFFKVRR